MKTSSIRDELESNASEIKEFHPLDSRRRAKRPLSGIGTLYHKRWQTVTAFHGS